nr:GntR family transcriptional regulator [Mangrovicella endophytica]
MTPVLSPNGGADRIARPSLHDLIVDRLRDMIIEGELAPGTRLHEVQLGERLGISRTPLREAIKYLASDGLVDLVPGRGASVKRLSRKDVRDMLAVIQRLEELGGELACVNASDEGIARVRVMHDEMLSCYRSKNRLEYYKLNQAIHSAMMELADNETLRAMHGRLQMRLKRIRFIGHEGPERWAAAVAEHEEMMAALEARDSPRLSAILGLHLANAWTRVEEYV